MDERRARFHNFGPASTDETTVYGACAPANRDSVREWADEMYAAGMRRVMFLLPEAGPLVLPHYEAVFGADRVFHEPIEDLTLPEIAQLERIMEILSDAEAAAEKIVVHCMAGIGRTGVVLAAWLVYRRGMSPADAVRAVTSTEAHRDPHEATLRGPRGRATLEALLASLQR